MLILEVTAGVILAGLNLFALDRLRRWIELRAWKKRVVQLVPQKLSIRIFQNFGFGTLIVVLDLVILAAIAIPAAIPAYQDYLARSQLEEAIQFAGRLKIPLADYYRKNATWPNGPSSSHTRPNIGKYTDSLLLVSPHDQTIGVLAIMKSTGVANGIAGLTVEIWTTDGGATWHCGTGDQMPVPEQYLPSTCRDQDAP